MKGYDTFYELPATVTKRTCQVCGIECEVERNQVGPTSWSGAVGKANSARLFLLPIFWSGLAQPSLGAGSSHRKHAQQAGRHADAAGSGGSTC